MFESRWDHQEQRLLTGYTVSYNRRHKRFGHLFQNRYKSVLCQEDLYLKELMRYIHLNPLRAGMVNESMVRKYHLKVKGYDLKDLIKRVAEVTGITSDEIISSGRRRKTSGARDLLC